MKHIKILTSVASLALATFLAALVSGVASLFLFLVASVAWILLIGVYSYTPRRSWLPRKDRVNLARAELRQASLALAA